MKKHAIYWHLLFWLFILLFSTANVYPYFASLPNALSNRALFLPIWLMSSYFNWWVLMPNLLTRGKTIRYLISLLFLLLGATFLQRYLCLYHYYPSFWYEQVGIFDWRLLVQFAAILSLPIICSILSFFMLKWYREQQQAKQLIMQQKSAELDYLKAQVNPHFLFNTLNTLFGLAMEQSPKVPDLILKTSELLSYSLYQSSNERIALRDEIKLIENFIVLEKERFANRVEVDFKKSSSLDETIEIAPLLFIALVENAFKHGVKDAIETVPISIQLQQQENTLEFEVKNKFSPSEEKLKTPQGVGLKNLVRRLNLLYPNRHQFSAQAQGDYFVAHLKLSIDE
ncbi:MAG: sensor histidine kinase [Saprospiraceae bacterium]